MWQYQKKLQYPIKIKQTNPKLAALIMSQYGGPDGEIGADRILTRAEGAEMICNTADYYNSLS